MMFNKHAPDLTKVSPVASTKNRLSGLYTVSGTSNEIAHNDRKSFRIQTSLSKRRTEITRDKRESNVKCVLSHVNALQYCSHTFV